MKKEYTNCIDACMRCASTCNYCAASCTGEKDIAMMAACIRLDMECAAICYATAELLSLGSREAKAIASLCATICDACGAECSKHTMMKHCQDCAAACKVCAQECRKLS